MKSITLLLLFSITTLFSQVDKNSELFLQLKHNDSLLFSEGFNNCNLSAFEDLLDENLEFYHDTGGVTYTKKEFIDDFKNGVCGSNPEKLSRKLLHNSLQVFELKDNGKLYGAIQKGVHEFSTVGSDGTATPVGTALFTHLWIKNEKSWKLHRVLSYNHQPIVKENEWVYSKNELKSCYREL